MDVRSLKEYRNPSYPDKTAVQEDPALLKTLPERWKHNAAVCAALTATTVMLMTACTSQPETAGASSPVNTMESTATPTAPGTSAKPTATTAVSVPLFRHGDGMGAFGCVSVAPPAFLSEAEAFEIINEMTSKEGLSFQRDAMQIEGIELPQTNIYADKPEAPKYKKGTILLDGVSDDKKVAFEFVSTDDIENWKLDTNVWSSVSSYDFVGTAEVISDSLNKEVKDMSVAVFYDPHYDYSSAETKQILKDNQGDYAAMELKLKELVKEDLRAQVRDFIAWLKAEGII